MKNVASIDGCRWLWCKVNSDVAVIYKNVNIKKRSGIDVNENWM